jgi:hypothetical protein
LDDLPGVAEFDQHTIMLVESKLLGWKPQAEKAFDPRGASI